MQMTPSYRAALARSAVATGADDFARRVLASFAARDFEDVPRDITYLNVLSQLAQAALALEDTPQMEKLYALLAPYPGFNTLNELALFFGSVSHFLGLLASGLGREEAAEAHFEAALETNDRMEAVLAAARTRVELARVLAARGKRKPARALAEDVLELARERGLREREREARTLLDTL